MNTNAAPDWLPSFLVPFFTLSYPTPTPAAPDSFPNSSYYGTGLLDFCFIITCIVVMAVLRDAVRLLIFEPLAKWKLTRDLQSKKRLEHAATTKANGEAKTNGSVKGNGRATSVGAITKRERRLLHRSVLRFAEQGWVFIYYTCEWIFGLVS